MKNFLSKADENYGWNFIMLTSKDGVINESPLVINLDTRMITVPSAFATCASVQNDQLAELVIFEVDRFFDFMDLSNTHIYVQWKNNVAEGDTRITMVDFESVPGKILFAWPLTTEITEAAGTVKFSVRFFRINDAKELIYSLNTQEAAINIKPSLAAGLNEVTVEPMDMLPGVILNSPHAGVGATLPATPRFTTPGQDIALLTIDNGGNYIVSDLNKVDNKYVANLANDTLTLCAQAYTPDLGTIVYSWNHITDQIDDEGNIIINEYKITDGEVNDIYIRLSNERLAALREEGAEPEANVEYYFKDSDLAYKPYQIIKSNFPIGQNTVLYERYTTFTVPEEGEVIGRYYAKAINTLGALNTELNPVYSSECVLPGPVAIEIKEDLPVSMIIPEAAGSAELKVVLPENTYNADISYAWKKSTTGIADDSFSAVIDEEGDAIVADKLIVDTIGWYKADISSILNRKSKTKESGICKVTYAPKAPEVTRIGDMEVEIANNATATLSVIATVENSDNPLYSEGFEYQWYIADNGNPRPIDEREANFVSVENNTLTIKNNGRTGLISFLCGANNVLNGMRTPSEDEVVFVVEFLE